MSAGLLAVIVFLAALAQVTGGFGFAIVAMPLATFALGVHEAAPLVAVLALLLNGANTLRQHQHVNRAELARVGLGALLGVPAGFWLSENIPAGIVRTALGAIVGAYALYSLAQPARLPRPGALWALPVGVFSGALGAAYNIPGPPLAVYGNLRAWPRDEYRSTLQAFFFANAILVVGGHAALGHYSAHIVTLALLALPALGAGNVVGIFVDRYIDHAQFRTLVLLLILASGVALLWPGA